MRLEDRGFFQAHYAKYPQAHSDNTFTNMACWNHYANYRYAYVAGRLVISSTVGGATRFRPPIGPPDRELMADLMGLSARVSGGKPIDLVYPETARWLRESYGPLELVPDRDHSEYVYLARDLAELPDGRYHSARRQLSRFRRKYDYAVEPFSPEARDEAASFLGEWSEGRRDDGDAVLTSEREAIEFAIGHFQELGLSGLVIRVGGKIGALSIFEPLSHDTAVVHFEKGLPAYEGIYKAINQETAAALAGRFEFINRESDMGIPGLREAKTRYHPHHMAEVYSLRGWPARADPCPCRHLFDMPPAAEKVRW